MEDPGPSQFKCLFEDCGKTFTRKDHLVRHANNHSETSHYCPTCGKGFKRPDLLLRHLKRDVCNAPSDRKRPRTGSGESPMDDLSGLFDPNTLSEANIAAAGLGGGAGHAAAALLAGSKHLVGGIGGGGGGLGMGLGGTRTGEGIGGLPAVWLPAQWEENFSSWLTEGPNAVDDGAQAFDFQTLAGGKRVQESAERGGEVKLVSPGLLARLIHEYGATATDLDLLWVTEAMQHYWTDVAPSFPFIHRGTFDVDTAPLDLVMMMIISGSVFLPGPRRDFRKTVETIRSQLMGKCGLDMPITVTQTFALCHIHDTWYGSREAQFMAQCSWAIMVAHSRKKGVGVMGKAEIDAHDGEEAWTKWAKEEERRRSAYCVLLLDTQTSTFWSTHPARQLSVFAHNLPLPCSKMQWEAQSVAEWFRCREPPTIPVSGGPGGGSSTLKTRRSAFMPTLNPEFNVSNVADGYSAAVLAALSGEQTPQFKIDDNNKFGVEMVLMGLMAAAWDCKTKGQLGLRHRDTAKHWREIIMNAVIELRKNWENSTSHVLPCVETRDLRDSFALSIVFVLCDIPMLLVAAGVTTVSGTHIGPKQVAEAKRRIKIWHKTDDAFKCLWQSSRYLRAALYNDWGVYTPWAVYLTTLVVWAFAAGSHTEDYTFHPSSDYRGAVNRLFDAVLQLSGRPDSLEAGIGDLLVEVAEILQTGEEVMREEAGILLKLAGRPAQPNGNP